MASILYLALLCYFAASSVHVSHGFMFSSRLAALPARRIISSASASSSLNVNRQFALFMSSERKAGVASPEELKAFVAQAGSKLLVVDVRNPNAEAEPGDQKSLAVAKLPGDADGYRPQAVSLIYDRTTKSLPIPENAAKDTPIITHCGGGGRGQLAKDFLEENGFTKVLNGGGPKETECWAEFGDK
jgi:rhodanese-related sulfurtransferase